MSAECRVSICIIFITLLTHALILWSVEKIKLHFIPKFKRIVKVRLVWVNRFSYIRVGTVFCEWLAYHGYLRTLHSRKRRFSLIFILIVAINEILILVYHIIWIGWDVTVVIRASWSLSEVGKNSSTLSSSLPYLIAKRIGIIVTI